MQEQMTINCQLTKPFCLQLKSACDICIPSFLFFVYEYTIILVVICCVKLAWVIEVEVIPLPIIICERKYHETGSGLFLYCVML